jgi:glycerol kinase
VWDGLETLSEIWSRQDSFTPAMESPRRAQLIAGWKDAVARTLSRDR